MKPSSSKLTSRSIIVLGMLLAISKLATAQVPGQAQPSLLESNYTSATQAPIAAPPLSFVDINTGRFGKLEIDMQDGQFMDGAADSIHLTARQMDFGQGELQSLDIDARGAYIRDFIIDKLTMSTQGGLHFDSGLMLNQKTLQFTQPATAQVTAVISQESLNKFLKAPNTLDRLSYSVTQKGGMLANLLGAAGANAGLSVQNAALVLGKNNKVNLDAEGKIGLGTMSIPLSAQLDSELFLENGWVFLRNTKVMTAGQELSPQLSEMLVKKVNGLSNLGTRSDDIHFSFTDLKVIAGKQLVVSGTAQINRLRFGRQLSSNGIYLAVRKILTRKRETNAQAARQPTMGSNETGEVYQKLHQERRWLCTYRVWRHQGLYHCKNRRTGARLSHRQR